MTAAEQTARARTTTSTDGTTIAYEAYGTGPAAVVVGGAWCDRGSFRNLALALAEEGFAGVTYDRRGRGDSTDTQPYAVEREIEDLAAVVRAAGKDDGPAYAFGISSGGGLLLQALAAGVPITRASALEVPYRIEGAPAGPPDYIATLERFEAADDREGILRYFNTRVIGMPEEMVDQLKGTPMWEPMLALAPTVRYDGLCMGGDESPLPTELLRGVSTPFLSVNSTGTQLPWLREGAAALAAALPNGTHVALEGGFHEVAPEVLLPALAAFFRGEQLTGRDPA
jgi:alpha-beta hydrolase superfamily lysophospholipase